MLESVRSYEGADLDEVLKAYSILGSGEPRVTFERFNDLGFTCEKVRRIVGSLVVEKWIFNGFMAGSDTMGLSNFILDRSSKYFVPFSYWAQFKDGNLQIMRISCANGNFLNITNDVIKNLNLLGDLGPFYIKFYAELIKALEQRAYLAQMHQFQALR